METAKDAKRYQWLKERFSESHNAELIFNENEFCNEQDSPKIYHLFIKEKATSMQNDTNYQIEGENLDEVIDSAMNLMEK